MEGGLGLLAVFDGSFDGFLCVIHSHYYDKRRFSAVTDEKSREPSLCESIYIGTDKEKAVKVMAAVRKISHRTDEMVYKAFLSCDERRFTALYGYIVKAFKAGDKINDDLTDPDVLAVTNIYRNFGREAERFIQFCRFAEMENGVYYSKIAPKSNVLPIVAEHFADRFQTHAWLIHDETYSQAAVFDGNDYIIADISGREFTGFEADSRAYGGLWKAFFKAVAVEGRINYRLQRNHIPLWYRKNMLEFDERIENAIEKKYK